MNDLRKAAEMALDVLCVAANDAVPNDIDERLEQAAEALRQALAQPTWRCPLKKPDCKENCGSYGCGN